MQISFRKIAKISSVLVYLVIAAGAIVRMTGSGMGCPDWPKCFGYLIPPTEASELAWEPNRSYEKGQVIIVSEALLVAKTDFKTEDTFLADHWEPYTKHEYAIFNPWHTWIEFINRLLGALAGLGTLVLAIASLRFWRKRKTITVLSFLTVFAMGFQAWLGATVVYSVLEPVKITIHMVMALVIVALLLYITYTTKTPRPTFRYDHQLLVLIGLAALLSMVQIVMGTQVRQFVDHRIDVVGEIAKNLWLQDPDLWFYVHRSCSILVVLLNGYIAYRVYKGGFGYTKVFWVLGIVFLEVLSGIAMFYLDFPFASQPLHLILASLLFGTQFYLVLETFNGDKSPKSL